MVTAVQRLAGDERARDELAERGVARARRFRWEDTVDAYAELLRSVVEAVACFPDSPMTQSSSPNLTAAWTMAICILS